MYSLWKKCHDHYDIKEWPYLLEPEFNSTEKYLPYWLAGLTQKMAKTIGLKKHELGNYFQRLIDYIQKVNQTGLSNEQAILMLWGSVVTMTLKGGFDSAKGKRLEKSFFRAIFHLFQFVEKKDYWLALAGDDVRTRETDCEVKAKTRRIKIELSLSQKGNPEAPGDKVARLGNGDVVICDEIGSSSKIKKAIEQKNIRLIQIRNGDVVKDLYTYLKDKVDRIICPPWPSDSYRLLVEQMPLEIFTIE